MKTSIFLLSLLCSFLIGTLIGATQYKDMYSGVTWTDIGTLLVTLFGILFGFHTYAQWLKNKHKEDSYQAAKSYIHAADQIHSQIDELSFQYEHVCPQPGLIAESKETTTMRLQSLNYVLHYLRQEHVTLNKCYRDLEFWGIKLTEQFIKDRNELESLLSHINGVCLALNSQLFTFIENKTNNIDEVTRHKDLFDKLYTEIDTIRKRRTQEGFEKIFSFD